MGNQFSYIPSISISFPLFKKTSRRNASDLNFILEKKISYLSSGTNFFIWLSWGRWYSRKNYQKSCSAYAEVMGKWTCEITKMDTWSCKVRMLVTHRELRRVSIRKLNLATMTQISRKLSAISNLLRQKRFVF